MDWIDELRRQSERDACGTGFVADRRGRRSHGIVEDALTAVCNLEHRGAVSPDGKTSDGAGILTQIPYRLFGGTDTKRLGVGVFFLPLGAAARARCESVIEETIARVGLELVRWRDVPFDPSALGDDARARRPFVRQVLVHRPEEMDDATYGRTLFLVRRRIERQLEDLDFSIPSFSHRTIVYKALAVPELLPRLYPDLANPEYETAVALFHQRYSTNTMPSWRLTQPLRFLAHNGEINTLLGNTNRMRAREPGLRSALWGDDLHDLFPIVQDGSSDSMALDAALELLVQSGRDLFHSMAMLVPAAFESHGELDPDWEAFARYHASAMEPWDGPAALVFTDGRFAGAKLDRNGLRPLRYWLTEDKLIVGSEAGIVPVDEVEVLEKGRLGPGQMLAIDLDECKILRDDDIRADLASRKPWRKWVDTHSCVARSVASADAPALFDEALARVQKTFGYGSEHLDRVLDPMVFDAKEPIGSMGDDTPHAVLSEQPQRIYRFFKQRFAQVTNPPIDPLRERLVMSLTTRLSLGGSLLDSEEDGARFIEFASPIITSGELAWLEWSAGETPAPPLHDEASEPPEAYQKLAGRVTRLDMRFEIANGPDALGEALEQLCDRAEQAARDGAHVLILSDREVDAQRAAIPTLLATSAVHHRLIDSGLRMGCAIVCDAGDVIEDHDFACLLGYGAMLIHPRVAYESVAEVCKGSKHREPIPLEVGQANYRATIEKGILKIMAKLGISHVASYRGSQSFEALGLASELVERYFAGTPTRIGGATLRDVSEHVIALHADGFGELARLQELGIYRFRRQGEYHAFNPGVFKNLHKAVRKQDFEAYQAYAREVDERPPTALRDLLRWKRAAAPIPLDEVEPAADIARRFTTQAMSFGALSRETHELLGVAMNRLGGKSNSGEGGEEVVRFRPYAQDAPDRGVSPWHPKQGDWGNSAIKQVASGRFGVTPDYLVSAREIEIKMAQGSKPGEGGQIPGHKVTRDIARTRRSIPGVTLISPPPHHDIYSIEDLAQLIYDLKRINRTATVCVKLVSVVGVGTIAAGVAKGYADTIQISGHDGGTGASPLGSIKHAGLPWELGLAETQQTLVVNDLRGRVKLRVDGGLKTGRDVVLAALLGGEEFGFGTAALVAAGCVMARQCHSNTCPVGVATQREDLRARFPGQPDHVISFMMFVAEHVRMILAELGARSLDEIIGRSDLLEVKDGLDERAARVDLSMLLRDPDPTNTRARRKAVARNDRPEPQLPLDQRVLEAVWQQGLAPAAQGPVSKLFHINNRQRSVGARLSGEIARSGTHVRPGTIQLHFRGQAGQSFGAFCNEGMRLVLEGEAQDYVAKGMAGGEIIIRPPRKSKLLPHENVIVGNTVAYGATGGCLFAAGVAGERLAVRNSGATIVVEGCGDHGCEYMTGGTVVVLGTTGLNFGAGMSGGEAFVYDPDEEFARRLNDSMAVLQPIDGVAASRLRALLEDYVEQTGSYRAQHVLDHWEVMLERFRMVLPRAVAEAQEAPAEVG